jgi:hypothetical protein
VLIPIIILSTLICIIGFIINQNMTKRYKITVQEKIIAEVDVDSFQYWVKPKILKSLYHIWHATDQCLQEMGVEFWATGGTLLGAIRHGGIIGWDNDIDISIHIKDIDKFIEHKHIWEKYGLRLLESVPGWRINKYFTKIFCLYKVTWKDRQDVIVDIFVSQTTPQGQVRFINRLFPRQIFDAGTLYPLKRVPFGPSTMMIANDPVPYLDRAFPLWTVEGRLAQNHGKFQNCKISFPLTTNLLQHPNLAWLSGNIHSIMITKKDVSTHPPEKSYLQDLIEEKQTKDRHPPHQ